MKRSALQDVSNNKPDTRSVKQRVEQPPPAQQRAPLAPPAAYVPVAPLTTTFPQPPVVAPQPTLTFIPAAVAPIQPIAVAAPQLQTTAPQLQSTAVVDIDADCVADCRFETGYVNEIYVELHEDQVRYMPPANLFPGVQIEANAQMRTVLVDWLVDISVEFNLAPQTVFLCINFLDRYLARENVPRHRLQLLGVACLMIAAKMEEVYAPPIQDFISTSDGLYSRTELIQMETRVLEVLDFLLVAPTAKIFLRRFIRAAEQDAVTKNLAAYLSELSLLEVAFLRFKPSVIAGASCVLANITRGFPAWTPTMEHYFHHTKEELRECVRELWNLHRRAHIMRQTAVRNKYAKDENDNVSQLPAYPNLPDF
eukprot:TRINITY_DN1528_c0_g1_i3.p1 TRINITY_DN1528_c0_g1~~TRINITY_DN1528_c0_g1_i3.p1  ORF type:complete len:374 (-),score=83.17 TRINITY_DN1528_c0_g1_i3:255-1355(-)